MALFRQLFRHRSVNRRYFSTVDSKEVGKFNAVATDWWNPTSTTGVGLLHQLNPVRVKYIRKQVIQHFSMDEMNPLPLQNLRVADIGCGGGILSEALCRLGAQMTSIDPGKENILAARKHSASSEITRSIDYQCCTSDELVSFGEQFDVVCSLEVIEHVSDVNAFLKSLTTLVKPGGLLFVSTINRTPLSYLFVIAAAEYVMRLLPPGTHDWNKFVAPEEIVRVLKQKNMQMKDLSGIVGTPILHDWHIDPTFTEINYILCASKSN